MSQSFLLVDTIREGTDLTVDESMYPHVSEGKFTASA